jgi:hypothetical protein
MIPTVLRAPVGKHDSCIVGENGSLRVIDPPKQCHGKATCCICDECVGDRQAKAKVRELRVTWQPWEVRPARRAA